MFSYLCSARTYLTSVGFHIVFSHLVDVKTGWDVCNWPCVQPKHCQQQDGYNCGVYVCFVSKKIIDSSF